MNEPIEWLKKKELLQLDADSLIRYFCKVRDHTPYSVGGLELCLYNRRFKTLREVMLSRKLLILKPATQNTP